jgi:hypothetical protein
MAPPVDEVHDFGDGESLTRLELQKALKYWGLPSGGTNIALRERYRLCRNSRICNVTTTTASLAPAAAAAKSPPSARRTRTTKKKAAPPEKRLKRFRSSCPNGIQQRIERAKTQRMFLVQKDDEAQTLTCQFVILGSTGNLYTVKIAKVASCTCPDHQKGNLCKHILFVLLKVMAINPSSPLIYQAAWLRFELQEMFDQMTQRYQQVSGAVMANSLVRATFAKFEKGEQAPAAEDDDGTNVARRQQVKEDDDCPICFDVLQGGGDKITFCRANCGANFHQGCINHWLRQHRTNPTCPICREAWEDGKPKVGTPIKEGFTNLGRLQGQSPYRDTSTYNSWRRW